MISIKRYVYFYKFNQFFHNPNNIFKMFGVDFSSPFVSSTQLSQSKLGQDAG